MLQAAYQIVENLFNLPQKECKFVIVCDCKVYKLKKYILEFVWINSLEISQ